jgi:hypothetical protein
LLALAATGARASAAQEETAVRPSTPIFAQAPIRHYECPSLITRSLPDIELTTPASESEDQATMADLAVVKDDNFYTFNRETEKIDYSCIGEDSYVQLQVLNQGQETALNSRLNIDTGINPAGIHVNSVTTAGTNRSVDECRISANEASVDCNFGDMYSGQQEVLKINFSAARPALNSGFDVNFNSDTADIDSSNNDLFIPHDIYPRQAPNSKDAFPKFGNGRIRKISARCVIAPLRVASKVKYPLYNGKIRASVVYSSDAEGHVRTKHTAFTRKFAKLSNKGIFLPIKVCNVAGEKNITVKTDVKAANTLNGYGFNGAVSAVKNSNGKLPRNPWQVRSAMWN